MTAPIDILRVNHRFGDFQALRDIDLRIAAGEYIALLGPSGCGKTTLLNIIGGFITPTEGKVLIGGRDITHVIPAKRPTTTVFQDYALFPHMSLRDNVGFGLRMAGKPKSERNERAMKMLSLVGLSGSASKRPHELSGGQRQRVALARALAVDPDVLLLDEPLGALDLKLRRSMQEELKAIQRQVGTTFIHVTHDQEEAMAIADRIVVMNAGRIEDEGTPERIYTAPRSLFAAGFMGEMNRIPARAAPEGVVTPLGSLDITPPASGALVACLRPEAIAVGAGEFAMGPAKVIDASFFGSYIRVHLVPEAAPGLKVVAHLPPGRLPEAGSVLELSARAAAVTVFPAEE